MSSLKAKTVEEKLDSYRGKILSGVTEIEKALAWRLRVYFFPKSNIQSSIFYLEILNANYFSLERKISLFQKIPYFEKLAAYKEVLESLRFVQKLRNELAHWELWESATNGDEVVIYSPISFKKRKLNKKLMEEFALHDKRLLKFFGWSLALESKYGIKIRDRSSRRIIQMKEAARLLSKYNYLK